MVEQQQHHTAMSSLDTNAGRPTIWVPDGVLDHLLARETALARPNMPLLDRFFARFTYW